MEFIAAFSRDKTQKTFLSDDYNYVFSLEDGSFARWGTTRADNPQWSPFGPEILDIEISTICNGIPSKDCQTPVPCKHCYKSNTRIGKNMSFDTFKCIIDKFPKVITQVAYGIGDIDANPDFFKMMKYCRSLNIIPNYTTNGFSFTKEHAINTVDTCGAIAISSYSHNKDICYDTVKLIIDTAKEKNKNNFQVNIHCLLSKETLEFCYEVANDSLSNPRLKGLNAIVFLLLKDVGRGSHYSHPSLEEYKKFLNFLYENKIRFGHDSCCYPNLIWCSKNNKEIIRIIAEPCESTLFSSYINVDGVFFPCSFCESKYEGIDVVNCNDFLKDVWLGKETNEFRETLINSTSKCDDCEENRHGCRKCPVYKKTSLCCG